ncbi:MAG: phytanoyl-CoA dioxygenase family protein [Burkholderiaceae bacterium]
MDTRTLLDRVCDPLRVPGRRAWYFLQPYGLADAYLTCSMAEAFGAARGGDEGEIHVVLKQSHAPIGRLFGGGRVRLSVADDRWLESLASDLETTGLRSELVPDQGIVLHPSHFEGARASANADEGGSRWRLYQRLLQLPAAEAPSRPTVPEAILREASALARSAGMPAGRTVLLVPEAPQAARVPDAQWSRLAADLSAQGLVVFTMTRLASGGAPRAAIAGTTGLDAGLELLLPLCAHAGRVVVEHREILELLVEADPVCRVVALSTQAFGSPEATIAAVLGDEAAPDARVGEARDVAAAPVDASPHLHADGELALCALHEVQFTLTPPQRDAAAAAIARKVNETVPRIARPTDATALQALHEHGLVGLGQVLGPQQVRDIVDYFRRTPCFSAHVASYSDGVPHSVDEAAKIGAYGSYRIDQALQAPHLLELALNEELLNLCDHYLGCLPTLYSVHAWWTFVDSPTPGGTHLYHRDQDDHRFLSMFTYLTDVGPDDGPIDLLRGSHQPRVVAERIAAYRRANPGVPAASQDHYFPPHGGDGYDRGEGRYPIPYEALFEDRLSTVIGPAGSAFLADTFALHRGNPPTSRHRLACWIRYGLAKSRTYTMDRTHRVPASLLLGRVPRGMRIDWVTRLLVDHGR